MLRRPSRKVNFSNNLESSIFSPLFPFGKFEFYFLSSLDVNSFITHIFVGHDGATKKFSFSTRSSDEGKNEKVFAEQGKACETENWLRKFNNEKDELMLIIAQFLRGGKF